MRPAATDLSRAPSIYIDGEIVPAAEARVSAFDSGFNFADGVFEGIRVYEGRVFRLAAHLRRLYQSARAFDIDIGLPPEALAAEILRWLRANAVRSDFHFRPIVTRGDRFPPRLDPRNCGSKARLVFVGGPIAPTSMKGISVVLSAFRRIATDALDSRIKSLSYGNNLLARLEAHRRGADDGIMLDAQGFVSEASASNVFIVRDGKLVTPWPKACLEGITRGAVMDLATEAAIPVVERDMTWTELLNADEIFLTGTGSEIVPVVRIEGQQVGDGRAGRLTTSLSERFAKLARMDGAEIGS